ncbi:MAG: DUF5693 family protein [bacterium]
MYIHRKFFRLVCVVLFFVAIVLSLNTVLRRYQFESKDHYVDVVMTYDELSRLAIVGGKSMDTLLPEIKKRGVSSLLLREQRLKDYVDRGQASVFKGSDIINMFNIGTTNRYILNYLYTKTKVKANCYYIIVEKKADFSLIRDFMILEFGRDQVKRINLYNILEVFAEEEVLYDVGLGISDEQIQQVQSHQLTPVFMLKNSFRLNRSLVRQKFKSFVDSVPQSLVLFEGESVLGYPSFFEGIKNKFYDYNLILGVTEFSFQKGLHLLASQLSTKTLLVHDVSEKELEKQSKSPYILRYLRAAKERRVNVLLFHPFFHVYAQEGTFAFNLEMVSELVQELKSYNFDIKSASALQFDGYKPASQLEIFLLSTCLFFIFVLAISQVIAVRLQLFLLSYVFFVLLYYTSGMFGFFPIFKMGMAFLTAAFFPLMGIVILFPEEDSSQSSRYLSSLGFSAAILGLSLAASFFVMTFLSDPLYLMGIQRFVGVKTVFLIPILAIGLYFYLRPQRLHAAFYVFQRVFYSPLNTASLIAICFFMLVMLILILRSDHQFALPLPEIERKVRVFLETTFFARPRFKEFLIGYPFLMFSYYFVGRYFSRKWLWFFIVLGAIAPISVINSFCHVHTPLVISFYRSVLGLILGVFVGSIMIYFFRYFFKKTSVD